MKIRNEADLRRWFKLKYENDFIIWVEPAAGSSPGIPDCMRIREGEVFFFEFKVTGKLDPVGNGSMLYKHTLRPPQVMCIRRLVRHRIPVMVVVGLQYTDQVYARYMLDAVDELGNIPESFTVHEF